jgi:hypothetical protein
MPDGSKEKRDIPTWDVVTYEQFVADSSKKTVDITNKETNKVYKYSGKNFVENKTDELTEALLKEQEAAPDNTIYFFDEVKFMKPYINESNELEFFVSEAVMPTWFDSVEDIPEALRLQYGVRIPSQDKQTSVAIEWVSAFGPERGNSIIVPKEIIYISGSGFDYNKLFTQRLEGYFEKGKFYPYQSNYSDFKKYMFEEKKFFQRLLKYELKKNSENQIIDKALGGSSYEEKKKVDDFIKDSLLKKYKYPSNQAEYGNTTYPAVLNNNQLRISQKLLSEPEIVYSGIYETPLTVEPYKKIFDKFTLTVPKNSKRNLELLKRDYFVEELEGNNNVFYPFKNKKGQSVFVQEPKNVQLFSLVNFARYQKTVKTAKAGLRLLVNTNVLGIIGKRLKMRLKVPIIFEGKEIYEFQFKTQKGRRVFEAISTTISVTTDEAKESQLSNHGISSMDLKVMSILMLHGLDIEDAFAFTRSKGAQEYNILLTSRKLTRKKVFKSNAEIIASYLPEVEVFECELKREEFVGLSQLNPDEVNKKYFFLYGQFLGMYQELSKLLPAVKLKTGIANDVPGLTKSYIDTMDSYQAEKIFKYYTIGTKSKDFLNVVEIYSRIVTVGTKELLEMNPVFTKIQAKLDSSITSRKKEYFKKIFKYIEQFLLGIYAEKMPELEKMFENNETFKKTFLEDINNLYAQELPESDPLHKALKASKDHLRAIVRLQKGELRLNFEGKLNQKLKDLVADSWLLLKNSPVEEVRTVADGLFKYYFLKDAFQNSSGSLEIAFPAYKFKDISKAYDEILKSNDEELTDKFIAYFAALPEADKYIKNQTSWMKVLNVKDEEKLLKIAKFKKVKDVIASVVIDSKIENLAQIIKVDHIKYVLSKDKTYYPEKSSLHSWLNTYVLGRASERVNFKDLF